MGSPYLFGPSGGGSSSTGSAGAKNYLGTVNGTNLNGDFELGTTAGWSLGNVTLTSNLPTGAPTFGSGASGNLSISAVTSGKLAGTYSLSYASSAATTAGNLLASDAFTIDTEDQAKVMTFKFYYSPTSNPSNGNWSGTTSNSFGVAIYDVTNSAWIIPAGVFSMTQSSGVGYATGTFQTTSNSTQYRLCVYNANATSGAITVLFDDMFLGPETAPLGATETDWVSFTPTGSWSSNSTYTGFWRRMGDTMEVQTNIALTGAPTSANLTINLPSGYTIDTAKLAQTNAGVCTIGTYTAWDNGSSLYYGHVGYNTTTSVLCYADAASGSYVQNTNATQAIPFTFGNTDAVYVTYRVPISGWSSNVQMSNDTDTRVVAFIGTVNGTVNNTTPTITLTPVVNTHGAYSSSTYTVPVTGVYELGGYLRSGGSTWTAGQAVEAYVAVNGGGNIVIGRCNIPAYTGQAQAQISYMLPCNAGDALVFKGYSDQSSTFSGIFTLKRLSGPAVVAATESVNALYSTSAASAISTAADIVYGTKEFDSHNAMNASTGVYTVPVSGTYEVKSCAVSTTSNATYNLYKNGSNTRSLGCQPAASKIASGSTLIRCVAGDTLSIRPDGSYTLVSAAAGNWVSIARVGN